MVTKRNVKKVEVKKAKKQISSPSKVVTNARQAHVAQLKEFWKSELQALLTTSYATLDDAVYALIDRVISRVGEAKKFGDAEREFLHLTLKTDPEIRGLLSRTLKIRK